MPFVEFTKVDDAGEFPVIPDGVYRAVVDGIEERRTNAGDPMWRVTLRIAHPEIRFKGRRVFDTWAFSRRALPRMKLIASRFGIDVHSDRELTPLDFLGREIEVEVRRRKKRAFPDREENFVPFAGYRKVRLPGEDEVPF
jgi:hypothetical protein